MRKAYLTIDDSPTPFTEFLIDALTMRGVPALFFVRGDMAQKYGTAPLSKAIEQGFHLGNHMVSHTRTSTMSLEDVKAEILEVKKLIDDLYAAQGLTAPLYFRFPHMDRGAGGYIIDYDAVNPAYREQVISLFKDGLNITLEKPSAAQIEHKFLIQEFLKSLGYKQPFQGVTFPWFEGEMRDAADCMYSFSTSDWMMLERHKATRPFNSVAKITEKIDGDEFLKDKNSAHIILAHDKDEAGFNEKVIEIVDYFLDKEFQFQKMEI